MPDGLIFVVVNVFTPGVVIGAALLSVRALSRKGITVWASIYSALLVLGVGLIFTGSFALLVLGSALDWGAVIGAIGCTIVEWRRSANPRWLVVLVAPLMLILVFFVWPMAARA